MSLAINSTLPKAITSGDGFHHLVYSISGNTHTLFLDNSAIAVNISGGNILTEYPSISNLFCGIAGDMSYGYTGYIDDFKVFNRALTTTDVSAIYNSSVASAINLTITSGSNAFTTSTNNTNYYAFTTGTYTFTASGVGSANYLLVGGGGGGGNNHGGGGGAGGVLNGIVNLIPGTTYTITVGAGGAVAANGSNSTLYGNGVTITAYGGGYGGGEGNGSAYAVGSAINTIGSGGGGSGYGYSQVPGFTKSGQGFNGGAGGGNPAGGGGGGGSGKVGTASVLSAHAGGLGGDGTSIYSSTLSVISAQMNTAWNNATNSSGTYYIAGGGGGGTWGANYGVNSYVAPGGKGGGGIGGTNNGPVVQPVAPVNNTGSGGGGGGSGGQNGTAGASGLVILAISSSSLINIPTTIPGLALWLDATNTSSLTLSGTNVTQWKDLVGNNIFTPVTSNVITYNATGIKNKPIVSFPGTTNAWLRSYTNLGIINTTRYVYYFVVFQYTQIGANDGLFGFVDITSTRVNNLLFYLNVNNPNTIISTTAFTNPANTNISSFSSSTTNNILCLMLEYNGTNLNQTLRYNGTSSNTVTANLFTTLTSGNTTFGIGDSTYGNIFKGSMSEILMYTPSSAFTTSQIQQIEGYLAKKWDLAGNLPIEHPLYEMSLSMKIGGDFQVDSNGYTYMVFKSSGITTFNFNGNVEYLIIGGGGAGGYNVGAGGGAGGVVSGSTTVSANTNYRIVVGSGGTNGIDPTNGGNSSAFGKIADGGGKGAYVKLYNSEGVFYVAMDGGSKINVLASNGGSGGGGGAWYPDDTKLGATDNKNPGISTIILGGNRGGYGHTIISGYTGGAGGGGGSGTTGSNGAYSLNWGYGQGVQYDASGVVGGSGGNGGNGTDLFASWISAISSNMDEVWRNVTSQGRIAAGGGGGASATRIGAGGLGGGGNGGSNHSRFWNGFSDANPTDGITNTGSGGGGAGYVFGNIMKLGGNGGSGLVIIRYPK